MTKISTLEQLKTLSKGDRLHHELNPEKVLYINNNDTERKELSYIMDNKTTDVLEYGSLLTVSYTPIKKDYLNIINDGGYYQL